MGWLTAAIVCTCIGIMFASFISLSTCDEGEKLKFIVTFAVTIIVSYIIANSITYVSTMPYRPREASNLRRGRCHLWYQQWRFLSVVIR